MNKKNPFQELVGSAKKLLTGAVSSVQKIASPKDVKINYNPRTGGSLRIQGNTAKTIRQVGEGVQTTRNHFADVVKKIQQNREFRKVQDSVTKDPAINAATKYVIKPVINTPLQLAKETYKEGKKFVTDEPNPDAVKQYTKFIGKGVGTVASIAGTRYLKPGQLLAGMTIGGSAKALENLSKGQKITKDLDKGVQEGASNAWIIALTGGLTDHILGKVAPKLVSDKYAQAFKVAGELTGDRKKQAILLGAKRTLQRALAETPAEAIGFGAWDSIRKDKPLVKAIVDNIPSSLLGNLLFHSASAGVKAGFASTKQVRRELSKAIVQTLENYAMNPKYQKGEINLGDDVKALTMNFTPVPEGGIQVAKNNEVRMSLEDAEKWSKAQEYLLAGGGMTGGGRESLDQANKTLKELATKYLNLDDVGDSNKQKVQLALQEIANKGAMGAEGVLPSKAIELDLFRGEGGFNPASGLDAYGKGKYYSTSEDYARTFGNVTKEKVRFENPLILKTQKDLEKATMEMADNGYQSLATWARTKGYDGIVDEVGETVLSLKPELQTASGLLAGLEPEYDEEGKFKGFKYNPVKGTAGLLFMAGIQSKQGKDIMKAAKSKITPEVVEQVAKDIGVTPEGMEKPTKQALSDQTELNLKHFNVDEQAKKKMDAAINTILPELESIKGGKLSNDEVLEAAKASEVLRKVVSKEETKDTLAAVTRLRQQLAKGSTEKGITPEFLEDLKVLRGYAQDAGRRLQILSVGADPDMVNIKEEISKQLIDLGYTVEDIVKAADDVDFNNPRAVQAFYRSFVKPSLGEVIDEYRYINLLSSPKTHIVNAFSNLLQVGVLNPSTKLYSGAIDFVASGLQGKERSHYVGEVPAYVRGALGSVGEGLDNFFKRVKGDEYVTRPDINQIPTGNKFLEPLQIVPRLLDASDVLFRTIAKGGEAESLAYKYAREGKEVAPEVLDMEAAQKAAYWVFRQMPDADNKTGQGHLLSAVDAATEWIYAARNKKYIGKPIAWFVPFVQTPMNILKQMIEYSPAGVATLPGAKDKTEQLAKTLIGATVYTAAAWIAAKGDSTWSAPTSEKDKKLFYATGRKPYSIRIGDNWVTYDKVGPLAMPIALATAVKYYNEQAPTAASDDQLQKLAKVVLATSKFFSDQSYVEGIGNLVSVIQGESYAASKAIGDIPRQLIPLMALQNWVTMLVDPIYRNPKTPIERVLATMPLTSTLIEPQTGPMGEVSERPLPYLNAISPIQISPQKGGDYEDLYDVKLIQKQYNKIASLVKDGKMSPDEASQAMQRLAQNAIKATEGKTAMPPQETPKEDADAKETSNKRIYRPKKGRKPAKGASPKLVLKRSSGKKGRTYKVARTNVDAKRYLTIRKKPKQDYKFIFKA